MNTLLRHDHVRLRQPASWVPLARGRKTARSLTRWLAEYNRRAFAPGIAAIQLGIDERVCVVNTGGYALALINPQIVGCSSSITTGPEVSLSFPGIVFQTSRRFWVEVEADNLPEPEHFGPKGLEGWTSEKIFLSCCLQQVIAHCYGLLPFDFRPGSICREPTSWHKGL